MQLRQLTTRLPGLLGLLSSAGAFSAGSAPVPCRSGRAAASMSDIPVPLRPLQQQEIVDKLDAVPVFSVVDSQTQQVVPSAAENGVLRCDFHLDVGEATAALERLQRDNPRLPLSLTVTPLGTAFALCEWEKQVSQADEEADEDELSFGEDDEDGDPDAEGGAPQVELRLQACEAEAAVARPLLSEAPVPPLLRRRNAVNGALPLFGSDEIRFAADDGAEAGQSALPLFFRRDDLRAAWLASGGAAEAMPSVQVTDLRTLAWQMQFDTSQDWRPLLFVAPASSIEYIVAGGGGEPAGAPVEADAAGAAEQRVELSRADVAGLIFGDDGGPK